jgi:hypothetical protein
MAAKHQPSLPAARAFIVQLQADANVEQGHWQGRGEHLVSYQATHFHSLAELLTFMAEVLKREPSEERAETAEMLKQGKERSRRLAPTC